MFGGTHKADSAAHDTRPRRDRGVTFIELLIAVVLIGTVVVTVLAALQTTIRSTTISRDHAKAQQWLQSAVGVLQAYEFVDCEVPTDGPLIQEEYQEEVRDRAEAPYGFAGTIEVSIPKVWNGATQTFVDFAEQDTTCFDDNQMRQQLITVTVAGSDGINEQVEVVKRGF